MDYYAKLALQQRYYPQAKLNTLERLRSKLDRCLHPDSSVLDAGCGPGTWVLERYQDQVGLIMGLDASVPQPRKWSLYTAADLVEIPFATASFDVILCNDVVEHLDQPAPVLRELWRVLAPSGTLILRTTSLHAPTSWLAQISPMWVHRWVKRRFGVPDENVFPTFFKCNTMTAVKKTLSEAGFADVEVIMADESFEYLAFNRLTYSLGLLYSRFVDRWLPGLGNVIIAEGLKPQPSS